MYFNIRPEKAFLKREGGVQTHKNRAKYIFLARQSLILTLVQTHLSATACGLKLPAHHELNSTTVYGFTIADKNAIKQFQTKQNSLKILKSLKREVKKNKPLKDGNLDLIWCFVNSEFFEC